jgi:hypothetical protein
LQPKRYNRLIGSKEGATSIQPGMGTREREATELEIQAMLDFVEQLAHWRRDTDPEPLINALREAARTPDAGGTEIGATRRR